MADVESMLDEIIAREGGYVNHAADKGGPTKYGITQKTLSAYWGRPASPDDVQGLGEDTARAIYRTNYVTKPGIDRLPELIQPVVLDAAVNSGPGQSVKFLQQVLNETGFGPLAVDGGLGPKTYAAAAAGVQTLGNELNLRLVEKRRAFLKALVARDPSQAVFEKGWMARCDSLETQYA